MSKVYNKIVQSNTEPSKNDIWLKDGQMKTFGKEGWKSVGGGASENTTPTYVLEYTEEHNAYKDKYDELLSLFYEDDKLKNPNIILAYYPQKRSGGYGKLEYYRIITGEINLIFNVYEYDSNSHNRFTGKIGITITSRSSKVEKIPNNEVYIFEYSDDLKNIGLEGLAELDEAINSGKKIIIRYKFYDITPMITVPEDGVFNGGVIFNFISEVSGQGIYLFNVNISSWDYSVSVAKHALNFQ